MAPIMNGANKGEPPVHQKIDDCDPELKSKNFVYKGLRECCRGETSRDSLRV